MTGENKKQFEEWYINHSKQEDYRNPLESFDDGYGDLVHCTAEYLDFDNLPFEMQIGVYLAYYDSLGYWITIDISYYRDVGGYIVNLNNKEVEVLKDVLIDNFKTRNEAYKEAFKKADEIINKN